MAQNDKKFFLSNSVPQGLQNDCDFGYTHVK